MKTNTIQNLDGFSGTILIPVFETYIKSLVPIHFGEIEILPKYSTVKKTPIIWSKKMTVLIFLLE